MNKRVESLRSKIAKTFWITLTMGIAIFTVYVSIRTIGDMVSTNKRHRKTQHQVEQLEAKIEQDSMFIEQLCSSPEFLESFAREQYHMQSAGETVYILEE